MPSPLAVPRAADEADVLLPSLAGTSPDTPLVSAPGSLAAALPDDGQPPEGAQPANKRSSSTCALLWTAASTFGRCVTADQDRFLEKARTNANQLYAAPTPIALCADMLLSALNAGAHVYSAAPMLTEIEMACVRGLARAFGLGKAADGLTMPGGAASNTLALQTALSNNFGGAYRTHGVLGAMDYLTNVGRRGTGARPALLTSRHAHFSLQSAAAAAGLGVGAVVQIECDDYGRMDPAALEQQLKEMSGDAAHPRGYPFFVNATSGTTVLGSFDNLRAISAICRTYGCWLHVDASWGGAVVFSAQWRHLLDGVEGADSLTFNPHKLLCVPQQCSFLLVRDAAALRTHAIEAGYLFHHNTHDQAAKSLGCGRRSDALKLYLAWLRYGTNGFGEHINAGISMAHRLRALIEADPRLELGAVAEPQFLQLCFRPTGDSARVPAMRDALLREDKYALDFAPVRGEAYFRIVTHPRVPYAIYEALVQKVADMAGN